MNLIRILLLLVVSVSFLFNAACEKAQKAETIEGTVRDYWPLQVGNEWTYECSDDKRGMTYQRKHFIEDIENNTIKYKKINLSDGEDKTAYFVIFDENTLAKSKAESFAKSNTFDPPIIFFLTGRVVGTKETYETTASLVGIRLEHTFSITGIEDIGNYKNAVKIDSRMKDIRSGNELLEDVWWVKGIGRVKWVTKNPGTTIECVLVDSKLK